MEELERQEEELEKVPVVVRKHEQKLAQEQPVQEQEPDEQSGVPRRWYVY